MNTIRVAQVLGQMLVALVVGAAVGGLALGALVRGCAGPAPASVLASSSLPAPLPAPLPAAARGLVGLVVWEVGQVVRVVDGDTYEVLVSGGTAPLRVRLLGVDAPERDQPGGQQATDSAQALLLGRVLRLRRRGLDRYGRTLGNLVLPAGTAGPAVAVDSLLVVRGWAWAYDPTRPVAGRARQQTVAQRARRGLWKCGTTKPVPPKVWRAFNQQDKRRYGVSCTR